MFYWAFVYVYLVLLKDVEVSTVNMEPAAANQLVEIISR